MGGLYDSGLVVSQWCQTSNSQIQTTPRRGIALASVSVGNADATTYIMSNVLVSKPSAVYKTRYSCWSRACGTMGALLGGVPILIEPGSAQSLNDWCGFIQITSPDLSEPGPCRDS